MDSGTEGGTVGNEKISERMLRIAGSAPLTISVVIPVHNGAAYLERCLTALSRTAYSRYECVVVDDGSTDRSAQVARRHGARVITLAERRGPAHARNRGAEAAQGEILLFVDADVCVYPETVGAVAASFAQDPDLAALIGSYDDEPDHPSFLSQYKNLFHHFVHQCSHEEASTFWSGCGAVRRSLFLAIGGFNEGYATACIEDIELGSRLRQAGQRIRLEKRLQVKHLKRWGLVSLIQTDLFRRGVPWIALMLREQRMIRDLNLSWHSRVGAVLTYALVAALAGLAGTGHVRSTFPLLGIIGVGLISAFLHDRVGRCVWQRISSAGLLALALALWAAGGWEPLALLPLGMLLTILGIHYPLYRFFTRRRGGSFAMAALPFHLLFFIYCGIAIPLGALASARDWWQARRWATGPAVVPVRPLDSEVVEVTVQPGRSTPMVTVGAGIAAIPSSGSESA